MKPTLLFLFADGWDHAAFAGACALRDEFDVVCEATVDGILGRQRHAQRVQVRKAWRPGNCLRRS